MDKILTSFLEIDIIELPKAIKAYKENPSDEVLQWMIFLENPENKEATKIMQENEDIKEAKEELDKISRNDILRRMALRAEIERMDNEQRMYEARRNGKAEGKKEAKLEDAKKMLEEKMSPEINTKITGLTEAEILDHEK